jgi:hypothetical protein
MARLIVAAIPDETAVVAGSIFVVQILVSVTDSNGNPVGGLAHGNFKLSSVTGLPNLELKQVVDLGLFSFAPSGFYNVQVGPMADATWQISIYALALVVTRTMLGPSVDFEGKKLPSSIAIDHGQTVTRIVIAK